MRESTGHRVVITGVGPVSAVGIGREPFFAAIREGRSGIAAVASFDTARYRAKQAAEIASFDVKEYLESEKAYLDRTSELAFAGMSLALEDANLDPHQLAPAAAALLMGTAYGNLGTLGVFFDDFIKKGPRLVKPILFPHTYSNTTISLLAIEYGLSGYHVNFSSGHASAALALVEAYDLIRLGRATMAFAGGFEALSEILFAGFDHQGALSPGDGQPERCAPFDRRRNGTVLGEGCAIFALESLERAQARGARIHGEIVGAGVTANASVGQDAGAAGILEAMRLATKGQPPGGDKLGCILASANGSAMPDASEGRAIAQFLGGADIPVTSIKPLVGETVGASGALQLAGALAILDGGFIPPMPNLSEPEAGLKLNLVVRRPLNRHVSRVLLNTVDPAGSAVALAVEAGE